MCDSLLARRACAGKRRSFCSDEDDRSVSGPVKRIFDDVRAGYVLCTPAGVTEPGLASDRGDGHPARTIRSPRAPRLRELEESPDGVSQPASVAFFLSQNSPC
jgi:hypothetical protein